MIDGWYKWIEVQQAVPVPFWDVVGEAMRFFIACCIIAAIAVGAVHVLRYTIKVYGKVRWWK